MTVAENVGVRFDGRGCQGSGAGKARASTRCARPPRRFRGASTGAPVRRPAAAVALARCLVTEPALVCSTSRSRTLTCNCARWSASSGTSTSGPAPRWSTSTHDPDRGHGPADGKRIDGRIGRVLQFATPSQLYREPADTTVAKFIGEGMIVPVTVVAVRADATCDVDVFGYRLGMRCPAAQATAPAFACLRASAISIVGPGAPGLRARVTGTTYQGGHFQRGRVRGSRCRHIAEPLRTGALRRGARRHHRSCHRGRLGHSRFGALMNAKMAYSHMRASANAGTLRDRDERRTDGDPRRRTRAVLVGNVRSAVAPIVVQSMTNTDTADIRRRSRLRRSPTPARSSSTSPSTPPRPLPRSCIRERLDAADCKVPLIRISFQRAQAPLQLYGLRPGPAKPHQSRQCRQGRAPRPTVRGDDRTGGRLKPVRIG